VELKIHIDWKPYSRGLKTRKNILWTFDELFILFLISVNAHTHMQTVLTFQYYLHYKFRMILAVYTRFKFNGI